MPVPRTPVGSGAMSQKTPASEASSNKIDQTVHEVDELAADLER
jgi:hypothetical protein